MRMDQDGSLITMRMDQDGSIQSCENGAQSSVDDEKGSKPKSAGSLTCKECGKVYKKKGNFEKHLKLHFNTKKSQIQSCKQKTNGKGGEIHRDLKEDGDEDVASESVCKRVLRVRQTRQSGKGRAIYSLMDCSGMKDQTNHDVEIENDNADDKVEEEEEEEVKSKRVEKKYSKIIIKNLECDICYRRFSRPENLDVHMYVHSGEKPFPCHLCSKTFARNYHLTIHLKRHSNSKKYGCDKCGESFKREDHLKYHKINNHEGTIYLSELKVFNKAVKVKVEKTILCEICGKGFVNHNRLKAHKKTHTENKKFQCKFCQKYFSNSSNFNVHIRLHTGKNPYKCVVCGECFRTSSRLKTHTRKHTGEYPFVCEVCGKLCGEKHLLKLHMQSHSKQKMHECSHCGKSFTHSSTLRAHIRLHTGSKPYVCQVCGHSFAQVSSLNYHKRTHTGEKPFTCHICGNSYTRKTTLNAHLMRHAGTKLVSCSLCDYTCYTVKQRKKHIISTHNISSSANGTKVTIIKTNNKSTTNASVEQQEIFVPNEGVNPSTALPSSTYTQLPTVAADTAALHQPSSLGTQFITFPNDPLNQSLKSSSEMPPVYFNPNQDYNNLPPPNNPSQQSVTEFTNASSAIHTVNSGYNPPPQAETNWLNLTSSTTLPSSSSSYQANNINHSSQGYYPPLTSYLTTPNANNGLSINTNGMGYAQKPQSLSHPSQFESDSLPMVNTGQSIAISSQLQDLSHFPNCNNSGMSTMTIIQGRTFESTNQKSTDSNSKSKGNIWETIGTSSHISQTHHNRTSDIHHQFEERGFLSLPTQEPEPFSRVVDNESNKTSDAVIARDAMIAGDTGISNQNSLIGVINSTSPVDTVTDLVDNQNTIFRECETSVATNSMHSKESEIRTGVVHGLDVQDNLEDDKSFVAVSKSSCPPSVDEPELPGARDVTTGNGPSSPLFPADNAESDREDLSESFDLAEPIKDESEKSNDTKSIKRQTKGRTKRSKTKVLLVKLKLKHTDSNSNLYKRQLRSETITKPKIKNKSLKQKSTPSKGVGKVTPKIVKKTGKEKQKEEQLDDESPVVRKRGRICKERLYHCPDCDMSFTRSDHLGKHVRASHKQPKRLICLYCIQTFENKTALIEHIEKEHDGRKPLSCNACSFSCFVVSELKDHVKHLHCDIEYKCDICNESFAKSKYLKDHMLNFHEQSLAFKCHICSKAFAECSLLLIHKKHQHSGLKAFKCNLCSKLYVAAAKLENHLRVHTGDKPYTCEYCGKVFSQLSFLSIHVKAHSTVKPYVCDYCSQCFTHKSTLTAHIRTHTGAKPFECDQCDKSFAQLSSLNYHKKSHDGLKPFTCELCGKSFTRATTLKTHQMQHDGKKRFSCDLCEFKCNRKHSLRKHHSKKHSGGEVGGKNVKVKPVVESVQSTISGQAPLTLQPSDPSVSESDIMIRNVFSLQQSQKETPMVSSSSPSLTTLTPYLLQLPDAVSSTPVPRPPHNQQQQQHLKLKPNQEQQQKQQLIKLEEAKDVFTSQSQSQVGAQQLPGFFYHQQQHQLHHSLHPGPSPPQASQVPQQQPPPPSATPVTMTMLSQPTSSSMHSYQITLQTLQQYHPPS